MNPNQLIRIAVQMIMSIGVAIFVRKSREKDRDRSPQEIAQARKNEHRVSQSARFLRRFGRF